MTSNDITELRTGLVASVTPITNVVLHYVEQGAHKEQSDQ
jgi:hypothetical protein